MLLDKILELSNKYEDYVIDIRRKIHQNPELSFKEFETSRLVLEELDKIGVEARGGIAGTGIMAELKGKDQGKEILLRAEMDGLPIEESGDHDFKSQSPGIMHACGHDVHTANLLGVAKILVDLKDDFNGSVKFIFQPGEEKGGGCKKMLDEGILDNENIHAALALHIMPIEKGRILISNNNISAYSDGFTIKVYGKSAHTSKPGDGIDAINIASHIVVSLNSIISKKLNPHEIATFSVGRIQGGRSNNVVADYVELRGMIRAVTKDSRDKIRNQIKTISESVAKSFAGSVVVEIRQGYPSIINDVKTTDLLRNIFKSNYMDLIKDIDEKSLDENNVDDYIISHSPLLSADDFGYISAKFPATYYMVGTGNYGPGHSPDYFVDEKYIKLCTRTMTLGVLDLLS